MQDHVQPHHGTARQASVGNEGTESAIATGAPVTPEESFASDLTKLLVSDSLQFLRAQVQTLQVVTGLLLTAYIALLAAVWKQKDIKLGSLNGIASLAPIALFTASLVFLVIKAATYGGNDIVVGDLVSAVAAYDKALAARRDQLVVPGILALLGLLAATGALLFLIEHG